MRKEKLADKKFKCHRIDAVTGNRDKGWAITSDDGWTFGVPKESPIVPTVGMNATFYGDGIGYTVRGLDLNGIEVFYLTEEEQKAKDRQWYDEQEAKRKSDYEAKRDDYDHRVAALPDVFRVRMEKFRKQGDKWRYEYEPYELFCLEEAVKIAGALKTAQAVVDFQQLDYKEQKKLVEIGDGHSGNTFGFSCLMARFLLEKPELAGKMHGSITPLVGCKAFGCH